MSAELSGGSGGDGGVDRLVVEQPPLDRRPPAEAAQAAVGTEHPVAGHEQGGGITGAGVRGGADGGGAAAAGGEAGVAVGPPGGHRPEDLPRLLEEGSRALADDDVVDRVDPAGEERVDRLQDREPVDLLAACGAEGGVHDLEEVGDVGGPAAGDHHVTAVGVGVHHDGERAGRGGDGGVPGEGGDGHQALLGRAGVRMGAARVRGVVGRVKREGTASAHRCRTA
jgi:hypothetical protein